MNTHNQTETVSKTRLWTARVMTTIAALFLLLDSGMKLLQSPEAVAGTVALGYPAGVLLWLGIVQLVCVILYLIPRTSIVGAIMLTGYLGGAIATHVRVESPMFTHTLFPIYLAALLWGAIILRETRPILGLRGTPKVAAI